MPEANSQNTLQPDSLHLDRQAGRFSRLTANSSSRRFSASYDLQYQLFQESGPMMGGLSNHAAGPWSVKSGFGNGMTDTDLATTSMHADPQNTPTEAQEWRTNDGGFGDPSSEIINPSTSLTAYVRDSLTSPTGGASLPSYASSSNVPASNTAVTASPGSTSSGTDAAGNISSDSSGAGNKTSDNSAANQYESNDSTKHGDRGRDSQSGRGQTAEHKASQSGETTRADQTGHHGQRSESLSRLGQPARGESSQSGSRSGSNAGSGKGTESVKARGTADTGTLFRMPARVISNTSNQATGSLVNARSIAQAESPSSVTSIQPGTQVVRGALALLNTNGGAMTVRLQPEELGAIRINLQISKGQASVQLLAESEQTGELIRQSTATLKSALESQGIRVEQISVAPLSRNSGGAGSQDARSGDQQANHEANADRDASNGRSRGFSEQSFDDRDGSRPMPDQSHDPGSRNNRPRGPGGRFSWTERLRNVMQEKPSATS
jgi:flagellar hook-length control protein FliK